MQTKQIHVRISEDDSKLLTRLAHQTGMSRTALARHLLQAGIQAVTRAGRLTLPLTLEVVNRAR